MAACLAALFALSSGSTRGAGDDAWLPISVHVALIGFDDALPVGASQLSRLLAAALPVVQPLLVETGEAFDAQYVVSYAVHHANAAQVAAVQNAVVDAANAQPQAYAAMIGGIERSVVDIDATRLNGAYTRLRDELLLGGAPVPDDDAYLVVVQRLDTAHMSPRLPAAHTRAQPTLHRFRYAGSAPAQAFVGSGRFLVVDLSAAPCRMGMLGADEGTVSADLLPALAPAPAGAPPDEVRLAGAGATRAVAALVLHAVEFVLAPSVRFCARGAGAPGRVLVPIIALRDHDAYDPLAGLGSTAGDDGGGGGAVDVEAVRAELSRWLLPEQQLEVLASTHPLHTHPALAVALARSLRSATSHELFDGSLLPVARPYADAAELLGQLRSSADVLGGELLRAGEAERAESSDAATARAATAAALRASRAHGFSGDDVGSDGDSDGVLSDKASRLLPVYVLSLSSEDSRLKLRANLVGHDHGADVTGAAASAAASAASAPSAARAHGGRSREEAGLLAVSRGAVVVLQPNTEHVPLGFFSEDGALALDGRDAQRHVIAGLLGALYGVMPPHERYAREVGRTEYSFLWAIGAHPFGARVARAASRARIRRPEPRPRGATPLPRRNARRTPAVDRRPARGRGPPARRAVFARRIPVRHLCGRYRA